MRYWMYFVMYCIPSDYLSKMKQMYMVDGVLDKIVLQVQKRPSSDNVGSEETDGVQSGTVIRRETSPSIQNN